jgi:hypothetical protein
VSVSLAIQHARFDPDRRVMVDRLVSALGGIAEINRLVTRWDIVSDDNRDGVWPTARRAWLNSRKSNATHHIVIQDDAMPCRSFIKAVLETTDLLPNKPISYFDMSNVTQKALDDGKHWAVRRSLSTALAVVMPVDIALQGLSWIADNVRPDAKHDDDRWSLYFLTAGIEVWYTAPSLVEHEDRGRSLLGNPRLLPKGKRRVAGALIGPSEDPRAIDWTLGIEQPFRGWSHPKSEYDHLLLQR